MNTVTLQINNEKAYRLIEDLEALNIVKVLKKAMPVKNEKNKKSAHDFVGLLSKKDAALMETAIEEACEQINPDDWK